MTYNYHEISLSAVLFLLLSINNFPCFCSISCLEMNENLIIVGISLITVKPIKKKHQMLFDLTANLKRKKQERSINKNAVLQRRWVKTDRRLMILIKRLCGGYDLQVYN